VEPSAPREWPEVPVSCVSPARPARYGDKQLATTADTVTVGRIRWGVSYRVERGL